MDHARTQNDHQIGGTSPRPAARAEGNSMGSPNDPLDAPYLAVFPLCVGRPARLVPRSRRRLPGARRPQWHPRSGERGHDGRWGNRWRDLGTRQRVSGILFHPGCVQMLRYTLGAVGLALAYWAVWLRPPSDARAAVCPRPTLGPATAGRWRSLNRWVRRAHELFEVPPPIAPHRDPRSRAARVVRLLIARGPPDLFELERAFAGTATP